MVHESQERERPRHLPPVQLALMTAAVLVLTALIGLALLELWGRMA